MGPENGEITIYRQDTGSLKRGMSKKKVTNRLCWCLLWLALLPIAFAEISKEYTPLDYYKTYDCPAGSIVCEGDNALQQGVTAFGFVKVTCCTAGTTSSADETITSSVPNEQKACSPGKALCGFQTAGWAQTINGRCCTMTPAPGKVISQVGPRVQCLANTVACGFVSYDTAIENTVAYPWNRLVCCSLGASPCDNRNNQAPLSGSGWCCDNRLLTSSCPSNECTTATPTCRQGVVVCTPVTDGTRCSRGFCQRGACVPYSPPAFCMDADNDGYASEQSQCHDRPTGDCNDNDATIHPGAQERCNGLDENCDGTVDERCVVQLKAGWNFISAPRASVVSPDSVEHAHYSYDGVWKRTEQALMPGRAYWADAARDGLLQLKPAIVTMVITPLRLAQGFNVFGLPSDKSRTTEQILLGTKSLARLMDEGHVSLSDEYGRPVGITLYPYKGYVLFVKEAAVIELDTDMDGIPDIQDRCPDTVRQQVDANGCVTVGRCGNNLVEAGEECDATGCIASGQLCVACKRVAAATSETCNGLDDTCNGVVDEGCKKTEGDPCTSAIPTKQSSECSGLYCVHGYCRSQATYCGDGFCDKQEVCSQDCLLALVPARYTFDTSIDLDVWQKVIVKKYKEATVQHADGSAMLDGCSAAEVDAALEKRFTLPQNAKTLRFRTRAATGGDSGLFVTINDEVVG